MNIGRFRPGYKSIKCSNSIRTILVLFVLALSIVSGYNCARETRPGKISVVCVVTKLMAAISAFKLYVYSVRMLKRREVALKNAREYQVRPPPISINCSDSIPTISVLFIY